MNRVIAVVEGQTEQAFVRDVLAPWLARRGVVLNARLVGMPGKKGGVGDYSRARRDILALLKQQSVTIVTTMFDFYGMPAHWPGRKKASRAPHARKAPIVEQAVLDDIVSALGARFNPRRFRPYVQMYEFEALLFSRPEVLAETVAVPGIAADLQAIREAFATPEEIDDGPQTAPSKRIERLTPAFEKSFHGVIAAKRIGISAIRGECPHFNEWLSELEAIGPT